VEGKAVCLSDLPNIAVPCATSSGCGAGQRCVDVGGPAGVCFFLCPAP
jgi:hypothetical protein